MKGIVKWFSQDKGFGFIRSYDGEDVFVHLREVKKSGMRLLDQGQRIEFEVRKNEKGKFAVNLVNLWPV
ncbi:cold shock domain-containing protein [Effusibacillus consociatus]|uniref:Cold shock domain-containing protein n=1 Tax=Effusibacillus consociatus TaxID=1117041 RepID=A0ABV9Q6S0_9BACL